MANSVKLEIITPSKMFYRGEVELVIVRTLEGDEGFMYGHSWACKLLDIGELWIREKDSPKNEFKIGAVAGGFIDVKDSIIIYTDAVEWSEDIDKGRVLEDKAAAEEWLRIHGEDEDPKAIAKVKTSLAKAEMRAAVADGGIRRKR